MRKRKPTANYIHRKAKFRGGRVLGPVKKKVNNHKMRKLLAICMVVGFVFIFARMYMYQRAELIALQNQKVGLEKQIIEIQEETRNLQQEATQLDDVDYIETVARNEYGMVGKEDIIFIPAHSIQE